jgi:Fe-Mn family superoxide dismutase
MFSLTSLPYAYDALQPYIDAQTMEIHHSKHHQAYIDKLNAAIADTERIDKPLDELLQSIPLLPKEIQSAVRNHGWWHRNHTFFRAIMTPGWTKPWDQMNSIINKNFWSLQELQKQFNNAALANFGSGWTWIIKDYDELKIINTPNQNNPLMNHQKAILGIDVREHAYYLKHQNRRADYLNDRWQIVNWNKVEELYNK